MGSDSHDGAEVLDPLTVAVGFRFRAFVKTKRSNR